jgi:hypothetical protein
VAIIKRFPVSPDTCKVLGYRVKSDSPAWLGLDFSRAIVRTKSTLMMMVCGSANAPYDLHLDVPFCHPDDQPDGWEDDMVYRVRLIAEPGKRWRGRLVKTVAIEAAPQLSPPWEIVVEFHSGKEKPPQPSEDCDG